MTSPPRRVAPPVRRAVLALLAACALGCPLLTPPASMLEPGQDGPFEPSSSCRGCHEVLFEQHEASMHARSFSNPVFQQAYFGQFVPAFSGSPEIYANEPACLACHAPIAYLQGDIVLAEPAGSEPGGPEPSEALPPGDPPGEARIGDEGAGPPGADGPTADQPDPASSQPPPVIDGVTCDFCHRITGYDGEQPGNANYIATPGSIKLGPFPYEADHHRATSELHAKSELCALCHSSGNRHGVRTRTTFEEWQTSLQAAAGVQCQDCHMTVGGFLDEGGASTYQTGAAATMSLGSAPQRDRIYTHRFVGAHSATQIEGALEIEIAPRRGEALPGTPLLVGVVVHNDKAAHKVPTGSAELRFAWLEVTANIGETEIPVRLSGDLRPWGVTGRSREDKKLLGDEIPAGRRIYRAVYVDAEKNPTSLSYEAVRMVFDNRLDAHEERTELYQMEMPIALEQPVVVEAKLYYVRFPRAFSDLLGLPPAEPVVIARSRVEIQPGTR